MASLLKVHNSGILRQSPMSSIIFAVSKWSTVRAQSNVLKPHCVLSTTHAAVCWRALGQCREIASESWVPGAMKNSLPGPEKQWQQADSCWLDYQLCSSFIILPSTLNWGWRSHSQALFPQGDCCLLCTSLIHNTTLLIFWQIPRFRIFVHQS